MFALPASSEVQSVAKIADVLAFAVKGKVTALPSVATGAQLLELKTKAPKPDAVLLHAGGRLSTDAKGATSVILDTTGTARMGEETEVQVPDEKEKGHSLELLKGKLFLNIRSDELAKQQKSEFRLKTPAALLAVKGTRFFAISKAGTETVGVHEGSVLVMDAAGKTLASLSVGQVVPITAGKSSAPRAMSAEEEASAVEYSLAAVVRTPLSLVVEHSIPGATVQPDKPSAQVFHNRQLVTMSAPTYAAFKGQSGFLVWPARAHNPKMGDPKFISSGSLTYAWSYAVSQADWVRQSHDLNSPYYLKGMEAEGPVGMLNLISGLEMQKAGSQWVPSWLFNSSCVAKTSAP